jgi:LAO/AO transport system kinase
VTAPAPTSVGALAELAVAGDRAALARILTMVEAAGDDARRAVGAVGPVEPRAAVVGVTGAPGAGKSTLTGVLVRAFREQGERVAVIAVDPSSPFSGGAILGDRVRLADHENDPGVYVRSMAARGHLGGLARATPQAVRVLDAVGFDRIVVETVGVGQSEVEVAGAADTAVVLVNPGWGDSVQAAKAGLLEVGDVFVVNKADRPGAAAAVSELERLIGHRADGGWRPPVLTTVATEGTDVDALVAALAAHRAHLTSSGELPERRERRIRDELRGVVLEVLSARAGALCDGPGFDSVVARVAAGALDPYTAASDLLVTIAPFPHREAE